MSSLQRPATCRWRHLCWPGLSPPPHPLRVKTSSPGVNQKTHTVGSAACCAVCFCLEGMKTVVMHVMNKPGAAAASALRALCQRGVDMWSTLKVVFPFTSPSLPSLPSPPPHLHPHLVHDFNESPPSSSSQSWHKITGCLPSLFSFPGLVFPAEMQSCSRHTGEAAWQPSAAAAASPLHTGMTLSLSVTA